MEVNDREKNIVGEEEREGKGSSMLLEVGWSEEDLKELNKEALHCLEGVCLRRRLDREKAPRREHAWRV